MRSFRYLPCNSILQISVFIITTLLQCALPAPTDLHQFELSMLNKLHKPWYTTGKPPQFPRKGEYPCKGGVCRTKIKCDDCQYARPLKFWLQFFIYYYFYLTIVCCWWQNQYFLYFVSIKDTSRIRNIRLVPRGTLQTYMK